MDRGPWWATVHGVAKSRTQLKRLSSHTHIELQGQRLPVYPPATHAQPNPLSTAPTRWVICPMGEPTLAYYHHPKPSVYTGAHSTLYIL